MIVRDLSEYFEAFGLEVFAAHEHLEVSSKWQQRIIDELRISDIFVALLTPQFRKSKWTDQEFGMALARDKMIVPLIHQTKPHGFFASYNYTNLNLSDLRLTAFEVGKAISSSTEPKIRKRFKHYLEKSIQTRPNSDLRRATIAVQLSSYIEGNSYDLVKGISLTWPDRPAQSRSIITAPTRRKLVALRRKYGALRPSA